SKSPAFRHRSAVAHDRASQAGYAPAGSPPPATTAPSFPSGLPLPSPPGSLVFAAAVGAGFGDSVGWSVPPGVVAAGHGGDFRVEASKKSPCSRPISTGL